MPSEEQEEQDFKNAITVVRALITSTKPPVSLRSIERDYINVEQEPIPFKRLGYMDAMDLLQDSNAFYFNTYGNEVSIRSTPQTAPTARALVLLFSLSPTLSLYFSLTKIHAAFVSYF